MYRRILCLTDGECYSSYDAAFRHVTTNSVIVDTVLLMNAHVDNKLKAVSHASGGVCVCPGSMQEALTFFELDSVLSMRERVMTHSYVGQSMHGCSNTPFETKNSFKSKHQSSYEQCTTITVKSYIDSDRTQLSTSSNQKRILKEMRDFLHSPHDDIRVYPSDTDCNKWKALMKGPEKTCYENGAFVLGIEFLEGYPSVPPEVRFLTPIHHCNISSSSGRICHSILGEAYTPATSVKDILCHIYGLLMSPELDSPLDSTLADEFGYLRHREKDLDKNLDSYEYFHEADKYFKTAKSQVLIHATRSFEELHLELSADC
ncbi:PREDICTED: ubiquitin-conjugating enzyme E2 E1-like [Amphimedon queenslandica]|uniref:UBC core domain-containing protein n=1 Tax=Amphimedon queenslandica TaxID=400682 RepID=A0AAN0JM16_AMPQE|nr:PREDICTED: ubiquitin-conjugating enzyme E2 E1-like [Amphimedon queenslandica]|eukprot:XP_019857801.1 PREDICTED: ubiquitin-conjugating enzyme E2 E1-like [Amphimedon queenslandica]